MQREEIIKANLQVLDKLLGKKKYPSGNQASSGNRV